MRHPDGPPATYYVENPSGGQCVENPWLGQPVRGKPLPSGRGIELADPLNLANEPRRRCAALGRRDAR